MARHEQHPSSHTLLARAGLAACLSLPACAEPVDHVRWNELTEEERTKLSCVDSWAWAQETLTEEEYRHGWCLFKATFFNDDCGPVYEACIEGDSVPPEECVRPDASCTFTIEQYESKMRLMYEVFGEYQSLTCADGAEAFDEYSEDLESVLPYWACG